MTRNKAVADIGTNSFHLVIVEINDDGRINTIDRKRVVMRIGTEGDNVLKHISKNEIEKSVEVICSFKQLAAYHNAEFYAVATSAVREAYNKDEFIDAVYNSCGIRIEVIEGKTEAVCIYTGIQKALSVTDKKLLCIDIGGGSTEIITGYNDTYGFIHSYKLGAVRLSKMFFKDYVLTEKALLECSGYIKDTFAKTDLHKFKNEYDIAAGASGTVMATAGMIAYQKYGKVPVNLNGFTFNSEQLNEIAGLILKYPAPEERSLIKGMDNGRSDIIPAGILILKSIFAILEIKELTVSAYALREGYLYSILKNH